MRSIRPGRGDITTTRSASSTASSIECVMNSTVLRVGEPQRLEVEAHLLARQRIERAERLVHQQQRRVVDQRARDRDALAHAARQLVRIAIGEIPEPDLVEQPQRTVAIRARVERRATRPAPARCRARCASRAAPGSGTRCRGSVCGPSTIAAVDAHLARARQHAGRRRGAAACSCRSPTARRSRGTRPRGSPGRRARAHGSRERRGGTSSRRRSMSTYGAASSRRRCGRRVDRLLARDRRRPSA